MSPNIQVLSGLKGKTPAAILFQAHGSNFLLDAGADLETHGLTWSLPERIDALFITHDHFDHMGGVAAISESIPIYCSELVASKLNGRENVLPIPVNSQFYLNGIKVTTGAAGHALGGIWFHFDSFGGLFYSGDFSLESQLFRFDPPPPARIALLDMSYGDYDLSLDHQKQLLSSRAHKRQQLFPVPPSGRSLELALWLMEHSTTPIAFDHECHWHLRAALGDHDHGIQQVSKAVLRKLARQVMLLEKVPEPDHQVSLLAGSADLDGGLASECLEQAEGHIFTLFTGHMGEAAQAIHQSGLGDFLRWNVHPRLSDIHSMVQHLKCEMLIPLFLPESSQLDPDAFGCQLLILPHLEC